jgi:hypothetical protein
MNKAPFLTLFLFSNFPLSFWQSKNPTIPTAANISKTALYELRVYCLRRQQPRPVAAMERPLTHICGQRKPSALWEETPNHAEDCFSKERERRGGSQAWPHQTSLYKRVFEKQNHGPLVDRRKRDGDREGSWLNICNHTCRVNKWPSGELIYSVQWRN